MDFNANEWYTTLVKPSFSPPGYLFGIVWSVLYPIIFASFAYIFYLAWKKKIPRKVALPFTLNLLFNFAFSPIQFGLQINLLASLDILLVLATLIWGILIIWKYKKYRFLAYLQIPYLLWVGFATLLQFTITYLNF